METLSIKKSNALKAYNNADAKGKVLLEDLIGKEILSQKITDRIKTFEDACADQGKNPEEELPWKNPVNKDQEADNVYVKLRIIAKSLKGTFHGNYADGNERKWYPYFEWKTSKSAFGFADSGYDGTASDASVGSRFAFPTEELSEYFGKQFIDLHNILLTA